MAAVAALRDGLDDVQSGIGSRLDTPSAGRGDPRQQIAREPKKPKKSHTDIGHVKHSNHLDNVTKPKPPSGGTAAPPGGTLDRGQ